MDKPGNMSKTASPITNGVSSMTYNIANLQNIGARARQEDSFTLMNALDPQKYTAEGLMFCVCDGMGGMRDGKIASETAIQSLRASFSSMDKSSNISVQMRDSLYQASQSVYSILEGEGGSTAVYCVILNERLFFACAGDSYLWLKRGSKLIRLNMEHNVCHQLYQECIRTGDLDAASCRADREAQALTSFLGMPDEIDIDYSANPVPLKKGDVIIACSDGVGGVVSEERLIELMQDVSVKTASENIENEIIGYARPTQDNFTALFVECQ